MAGLLWAMTPSCSEEDIETFDGRVSGIYFQGSAGTVYSGTTGVALYSMYTDSTTLSFASSAETVTETTVRVTVKTMGYVTDVDRPFVLKVDEAKSTAQRGVHFDIDESKFFVPAGAASVAVPVTVYRHPDLKSKAYRIELYLEGNENFTVELESYNRTNSLTSTTDAKLCGSRYKIIMDEIYSAPSYWNTAKAFFGTWTSEKYLLLNKIMDWTANDWRYAGYTGYKIAYGVLPFAAKVFRNYLQEAADSGEPILDEDGSYMQLPEPYSVDYSAYED